MFLVNDIAVNMLQPLMHKLASQRIILASGSPRRKTLLENIGLKFEVVPSTFDENLEKSHDLPSEYVKYTAVGKVMEVAKRLSGDPKPPDLIIGADTVVTMDDKIIEKPDSKEHAFQLLKMYSGRSHTVYTGVVLATPKKTIKDASVRIEERFHICTFHEATEVYFAELDDEIIKDYIETGEPMDKAGGYGIQALGGTLITKVNGDYFNVMGFPLHKFAKHVIELHKNGNL